MEHRPRPRPEVWATLGVTGAGAVVAGMDTGARLAPPGPQANYRGYNPTARPATGATGTTPLPAPLPRRRPRPRLPTPWAPHVGGEGIGVAPGARWIAVKVLNRDGYGYDSWIHAGFQWLLAPAGRPGPGSTSSTAPGGTRTASPPNSSRTCALRAAGVFVVFANGNSGPGPGTVISPASLPEAFAVDATDAEDRVAYFSSRGPSPWGEVRPRRRRASGPLRPPRRHLRHYERHLHGDPHVAGLAALLRAVSPTVDITRTAFLITSTAVPLSTTLPNNDSGWGRIDGFAAVAALMSAGVVQGTVTRSGDGAPIPGATVSATFHGDGGGGLATTDASGRYTLPLAPGPYDLTARAFGYAPSTRYGVIVTAGATVTADFALTALPTGALRVALADEATGARHRHRLRPGHPAHGDGLPGDLRPAGRQLHRPRPRRGLPRRHRHRFGGRRGDDGPHPDPPPAPSILLVDSGAWYYGSQIAYYRQALDDLALAYDEWTVRQIPDDTPTADLLAPTTWWSGARRTTPPASSARRTLSPPTSRRGAVSS